MSDQKFDIFDISKRVEAAGLGSSSGLIAQDYIQKELIPGCIAGKIGFPSNLTVKAYIYVQNKELGYVTLITGKQETPQKAGCSNEVLRCLVGDPIVLDIHKQTMAKLTVAQLKPEDFLFAAADEALQTQLDATPETNPLKAKFQYSLEQCRILWSRLRMSKKDEEEKIRFTIQRGALINVITLNKDEIARYTDIQPYTEALNAMTDLLRDPYNQTALNRLKTQAPIVLEGQYYNEKPVVGPVLVGIGLLLAITVITLVGLSLGGLLPPFSDSVLLRLLCGIGGMLSFFTLVGGAIPWMNVATNRYHELEITGFYDAVEAIETLQKNAVYQPDSGVLIEGNKVNAPSHPAGDPNAYGETIGQKAGDAEKPDDVHSETVQKVEKKPD